jgi:hypothetical protein
MYLLHQEARQRIVPIHVFKVLSKMTSTLLRSDLSIMKLVHGNFPDLYAFELFVKSI